MDFARFARILGYKNERSAQDSYHRFRARLRGDKNYGNRRGRAHEYISDRARGDGTSCHRDVGQDDDDDEEEGEEEEEEEGNDFIVGGPSSTPPPASAPSLPQPLGEGPRSRTSGHGRHRHEESERSKGYTVRGTVDIDLDEAVGWEGESEGEVIEVKTEIKEEPRPEVWSWEGTVGFKGYI